MGINITKPQNCLLGCCLPLEKQQFLDHFNGRQERDFIRSQFAAYSDYSGESMWTTVYGLFASTIKGLLEDVRKTGVTVLERFSLHDLPKLSGFDVFTILAHYNDKDEMIELFDGLCSKSNFVIALPDAFTGIYDLTACNGSLIRDEIRKRLTNQIISYKDTLPIIQMLIIYKHVILNLEKRPINYIDCFDKTITDLLN